MSEHFAGTVFTDYDRAAQDTFERLDRTTARLAKIVPAKEVTNAVGRRRYLHAGPPLPVDAVPGPVRGALVAGLMFEGEATSLDEAERIIDDGQLEISPGNACGGVGPVAGIVTPNMPVVVAESDRGTTAFSPLNEGYGRVMRFGANDTETVERLRWMRDDLGPLLNSAIATLEPIDLTALMAEALRRGDECHNRNVGVSAALLLRLAPAIVRIGDSAQTARAIEWAASNPQFFLPFAMSAAKSIAIAAQSVPMSPVVTSVSANGVHLGIQISGCGDEWFLTPSPVGRPKVFRGYSIDDAQPSLGDSFITEVVGVGACALTAAPAISSFLGTSASDAQDVVNTMRQVCAGTSTRFVIPADDYRGTPVGIRADRVIDSGLLPSVEYGLAHRLPGIGQIGAGITEIPREVFVAALERLSPAPSADSSRTVTSTATGDEMTRSVVAPASAKPVGRG
ncbi:DUF1116 domain-containing protein [Mycobacterium sp. NPDC003323]